MNNFLTVARDLALKAGAKIIDLRKQPLVESKKEDHSLVTNADHAADRIIRDGLRHAFKTHAILTEESGIQGSESEPYIWVVDPLDGTRAYARGVTGFSVMIGLLHKGRPELGVVYDPLEGHLYEAVRGEGCFHTFKEKRERVWVSKRREWKEMPVITSVGFPEPWKAQLETGFTGPWCVPVNSVGVKVGFLVRQLADIYVNHHSVHYWDTCAPQIILEEAGGKMTDQQDHPLTYALDGSFVHALPTVATNNQRHSDVVTMCAQVKR